MSDDRLRAALRAFQADPSPTAACAYVLAWWRAGGPDPHPNTRTLTDAWLAGGGRDPRLWPRPGDVVETESNVYHSKQFTVIRFPGRHDLVDDALARLGEPYDPAKQATHRGAPVKWAMVRRRRLWSDGVPHEDSVTLLGWRKGLATARVLKVACEACDGTGGPPGEGLRLLEQANRGVDPIQVAACAACLGTGRAIDPQPAPKAKPPVKRRRGGVEQQQTSAQAAMWLLEGE